MYSKKTLLEEAALAVLSVAGVGSASAAPWDNRVEHREQRIENRMDRRVDRIERRRYVDSIRVREALRFHHYRVTGDPYFVRGHYVVRSFNRFGRPVFVEINPYSGAFIGEFRR